MKLIDKKIIGKNMRLGIILIITVVILSSLTPAQTIKKQSPETTEHTFSVTSTITFSENDVSFGTLQGYDTVQLNDGYYPSEIGKPMLPEKTIRVAVPSDMKATSVKILAMTEQPLEGTYTVYPTQPPQKIGMVTETNTFQKDDDTIYSSSLAYPATTIELNGESDLAGQPFADLTISPLHYIPVQKKVTLLTSLTFVIEGSSGYLCGDYLSLHLSQSEQNRYQQMVQDMVINPENVHLQSSTIPQKTGVEPGTYSYVIITQNSWVSNFQPLADWKTKKGTPAIIVTTEWIYNNGGYSGTNVEKIKAFVQDAHTTWGALFFLLGGDIDVVPCKYTLFASIDSDPVPNDTFYADYDGDWTCEVNVGRASVTGPGTGVGQIGNFISKILTYEKNPPLTNYAKKAALFGFDLDASTPAEQCKIYIDNNYIPSDWTMSNVYDSQPATIYKTHKIAVIAAVNAGQNLINHADHSSSDFMGTGYVNHGQGLGNSDVNAFHNGNKQGIWYSMGCDPCAYDVSNCIAEHYVRDDNGGGVAFIGNSRYGWYNPGYTNTLSLLYDQYFFRSLFPQNHYLLGECFSDHKNDGYHNDDLYKYIYTELNLLGDPELPIWTDNPKNITNVNYPDSLPLGSQSVTFTVILNGNPVNGACVCLQKPGEVYVYGTTDANGQVIFNINPLTPGTMDVTVTKHNLLPWEGTATITEVNNPPNTPNEPSGPSQGIVGKEYTYTTETSDPEGDDVQYGWDWNNDLIVDEWTALYPSGTPISLSHSWLTPGSSMVRVKAKDIHGSESTWSEPLLVTIVHLGDMNLDGTVDAFDIDPFVVALVDPVAYQNYYHFDPVTVGDINQDGVLNVFDIDPFVHLLTGR